MSRQACDRIANIELAAAGIPHHRVEFLSRGFRSADPVHPARNCRNPRIVPAENGTLRQFEKLRLGVLSNSDKANEIIPSDTHSRSNQSKPNCRGIARLKIALPYLGDWHI